MSLKVLVTVGNVVLVIWDVRMERMLSKGLGWRVYEGGGWTEKRAV